MFNWLSQNWFTALQSLGIIASLLFAALSLRIDTKVRRVSNLMKLTEQHRDLWAHLITVPGLARVLSPAANVRRKPISREERWFVGLLILHMNTAYRAMKDGMFVAPEGLQEDVRWIFSFPVTRTVWETVKPFQDKEFVRFIEECRNDA